MRGQRGGVCRGCGVRPCDCALTAVLGHVVWPRCRVGPGTYTPRPSSTAARQAIGRVVFSNAPRFMPTTSHGYGASGDYSPGLASASFDM